VSAIASISENSLYDMEYVTFGEDDVYNQKDAEGFINLFTLPLKMSQIKQSEFYNTGHSDAKITVYEEVGDESMAGAL